MQSQPEHSVTKIVVIGAGAVGSTTAYTLFLRARASELVLIDINHEKVRGDVLDMNHGLPFTSGVKITVGSYADCAGADIVLITAGAAQRPGESRQDLLERNVNIFKEIVANVVQYSQDCILLIATNPVDVLSYFAFTVSGFPKNRVIGSGTLLDSARFRYLIGHHLHVDPRSVHAHIIGEHGDSELPVWSRTNVAGVPVNLDATMRQALFQDTRHAAYEIIAAKGATYYAIALALDRICAAILNDEASVMTVSTLVEGYCGINDVFLGLPCIVGRQGIREIVDLQLAPKEVHQLQESAALLKARIQSVSDPE